QTGDRRQTGQTVARRPKRVKRPPTYTNGENGGRSVRSHLILLLARRQFHDLDLLELDHGARVVTLQGAGALGIRVVFVHEVNGRLAIDLDNVVVALGNHFLGEPLVGLVQLLLDDDLVAVLGRQFAKGGVQAAGPNRIAVGGIDLGLVALG